MAFVCLSLLELIHSFNIRSEKSIFKIGLFTNIYLIGALLLGVLMQVIVVAIPALAKIFSVIPLNKTQWLYTTIISISPIVIIELQKKLNELRFGKILYNKKISCQIWKHNV